MEERICRNIERDSHGRFRKDGGRRRRRRVSAHRRGSKRIASYLRAGDMLTNPIPGAEVGMLVGVTALGYILTDMMSRYFQTEPAGYTPTAGNVVVPNAASQVGMPSWTNIGAQAVLSIVGFVGGGMASKGGRGGLGSAALYGVGLGAGVHLVSQLFSGLMARWAGSKTSAGDTNTGGTLTPGTLTRLYSAEIAAQNAQYTAQASAAAATPPGSAVPGFAGPPEGQLGQPTQQPGQLGQFWGQQPMMAYPQAMAYQPQMQVQVPVAQNGSLTPPANYIYVAVANNVTTDNGNGTKSCPDGSVIPSATPCAPPAYIVLGNGFIQGSSTPVPAGAVVAGYYYAPAMSTSPLAPPPPAPGPSYPYPTLPSCMPQPVDTNGGGCGCMGLTPDTVFPD